MLCRGLFRTYFCVCQQPLVTPLRIARVPALVIARVPVLHHRHGARFKATELSGSCVLHLLE